MKTAMSAFPISGHIDLTTDTHKEYVGMSLRDWFAGQALSGLCSATTSDGAWQVDAGSTAKFAYEIADMMLAEREKS